MSVPRKFWVLRTFGMIFRILAWLILIVGTIGAILSIAFGFAPDVVSGGALPPGATLTFFPGGLTLVGVLSGFVIFFIALLTFVFLYAFGDLVLLLIALEENTRLMAERMQQQLEQPIIKVPPVKQDLKPVVKEEPVQVAQTSKEEPIKRTEPATEDASKPTTPGPQHNSANLP